MDCDTALTAMLVRATPQGDLAAEAHVSGCARCRADAPHLRTVQRALDETIAPAPPHGLTDQVLYAAAPLLAAHARRLPAVAWPRMVAAIAIAILPLPLILFVGWEALATAQRVLATVLPGHLSVYLVAAQASVLALLLAITYGAVPLLAAHQLRLRYEEPDA